MSWKKMAKYPRTHHLPWSPGATRDDKIQQDVSSLIGVPIIISEKIDGSNVCLTPEDVFARSHSGPPTHESFAQLKAKHASVKHNLSDIELFGEWAYAKHSISYTALPSYLMAFGARIHGDGGYWLSWSDLLIECSSVDICTVPVLYSGTVNSKSQLESLTNKLSAENSVCGGAREGLVIRTSTGFSDAEFEKCVLKIVRKDHVQTSEHWKSQKIEKNGLV